MNRIILINGTAHSGKNTVAEYLASKLSKIYGASSVMIRENSSWVKETALELGWDGEKDDKGRKFLQDITKAGYDYDPHLWEKKTLKSIFAYEIVWGQSADLTVIIPDWRYKSTYDFFSSKGPITTIRVVRNNYDNGYSEEIKNHYSEHELDDFNFNIHIYNHGDLNHLKEKVDEAYNYIGSELHYHK